MSQKINKILPILQHVGCRGIPASIELAAPDEEKRLGNVALAGAGAPGQDEPLFALYKGEGGKLHDPAPFDSLLDESLGDGYWFID
jgi:hypothetical protein